MKECCDCSLGADYMENFSPECRAEIYVEYMRFSARAEI